MDKSEIDKKISALSQSVMQLSANTLLVNMRFMARALSRLRLVNMGSGENAGYSTDGRMICYNGATVLKRYRKSDRLPIHDILHMVLHCIFRHFFIGAGVNKLRWDAACDIAAEALIINMGLSFCECEHEAEKIGVISELSTKVRIISAEKLYAYFMRADIDDERLGEYVKIFGCDDHSKWYPPEEREYEPEEQQKTIGAPRDNDVSESTDQNDDSKASSTDNDNSEEIGDPNITEDSPAKGEGENDQQPDAEDPARDDEALEKWLDNLQNTDRKKLEELWKDISKQVQAELEGFNQSSSINCESLVQNLKELNRRHCDYAAFLKKFAVMGEVMKQDIDSFDVNFYAYGLGLYGNVALIEPPEFKEVKRVRDFVIAIDTSGSVSGATVQKFVQKTYDILKNEQSFFSEVNIYVIQCDTAVREAIKLTDAKSFEKYLKNFEIKGLGGTDFRPVFEYIESLRRQGELKDLKGLIYFTDGFGDYPAKKPDYDVAFAFLKSDYVVGDAPQTPIWAIRLIIEDDEILRR